MTTELRTARLLLRPFKADDVEDALEYRDDLEFARFLHHVPHPFTRQHAEAFVALNMSEPWDCSPTFGVELHGKLIGTVNLEIDIEQRSAVLGYALGRAWWGHGYATEAARAVVDWAFDMLGLHLIWASADDHNARSFRVMAKLDMQRSAPRIAEHPGRDGALVRETTYVLTRSHGPADERDA